MNPESKEIIETIVKKGRHLSAIREEKEFKIKVMRDFGDHARANYKPKLSNKLAYEMQSRKDSLSRKA